MEYQYRLRPHHGMCIAFFQGKGYSEEFTEHMKKIIEKLENNASIYLTLQTDIICKKCPNNIQGICNTDEKVAAYDQKVLEVCGWEEGMQLSYFDFRQNIHNKILRCGKREKICGDCEWNEICHFNEREKRKFICWINEQDKILSFHKEEGYVQKEFLDKEDFRRYVLAVSGLYKIQ